MIHQCPLREKMDSQAIGNIWFPVDLLFDGITSCDLCMPFTSQHVLLCCHIVHFLHLNKEHQQFQES